MVLLREEVEHKVDECTFEQGEVYSVDVAFSSGEGACVDCGLLASLSSVLLLGWTGWGCVWLVVC